MLMGIPLYVIYCFSLAAVNIFSLYLIFDSLINMCLDLFLLGFILYGTLHFLDLTISFTILGKFSTIISSHIFSVPFFFSSSSGTPIIRILVHIILLQWSLRQSSVLFILFFFILLCGGYFHYFIFQVTYPQTLWLTLIT